MIQCVNYGFNLRGEFALPSSSHVEHLSIGLRPADECSTVYIVAPFYLRRIADASNVRLISTIHPAFWITELNRGNVATGYNARKSLHTGVADSEE